MLIQIKLAKGRTKDAILCIGGLPEKPSENGLYWCEFYPVDSVLELRESDRMLEGHPLLDIPTTRPDGTPGAVADYLRPARVKKILRQVANGKMVALSVSNRRPPKLSRSGTWRRMQRQRMDRGGGISDRSGQHINFYFVDGSGYLTEADQVWLTNVCESGELYYQEAKAAKERLETQAEQEAAKSQKTKPKKPKLRRKDRRRLEQRRDYA